MSEKVTAMMYLFFVCTNKYTGALPALPGDGSGRGFSKELPETPCNPFIHVL